MPNYLSNVWLISENEFDEFVCAGGKVVYIVEDGNPRFTNHPALFTAGLLLPPYESLEAALDCRIQQAESSYESYLLREAELYIAVIIAAAINKTPIGIMFGFDEYELNIPQMFINFLYRYYGLVVGIKGKIQPEIVESMLPVCLSKLYMLNIIDYKTFMERHPPLPIDPTVISKMVFEVNPPVEVKDFQHYFSYFEYVKNEIYKNGGKFLIDPMVGI